MKIFGYLLKPFWNRDERRVRALWRILLHGLGFILLSVFLTSLVFRLSAYLPDSLIGLLTEAAILLSSLLILWLAGKLLDRRPFADYGFHLNRQWWLDLGFGLFLGAFLMAVIFLVELGAGWVSVTETLLSRPASILPALLPPLATFIQVGISEEILSRGYHLRNMAEGFHWRRINPRAALLLGYLLSSSLFGLLHLANPNATGISTFNIALAGLFLGLGFVLTKSLAIPIGVHITWNYFQGNIFGFPVSGTETESSLISIQQGGPDLMTGGVFGPEAGLIGLAVMFLGCLLTAAWVKWQHGKVALQDELAVYKSKGVIQESNDPGVELPSEI